MAFFSHKLCLWYLRDTLAQSPIRLYFSCELFSRAQELHNHCTAKHFSLDMQSLTNGKDNVYRDPKGRSGKTAHTTKQHKQKQQEHPCNVAMSIKDPFKSFPRSENHCQGRRTSHHTEKQTASALNCTPPLLQVLFLLKGHTAGNSGW